MCRVKLQDRSDNFFSMDDDKEFTEAEMRVAAFESFVIFEIVIRHCNFSSICKSFSLVGPYRLHYKFAIIATIIEWVTDPIL